MKVGILTIGDEVVSGKIVNTNASYLAKVLESNQFVVSRHLSVRDVEEEVLKGFDYLYDNADIVMTTGGLGPTVDDLTKEISAKYFDEEMVLFKKEEKHLESIFKKLDRVMTENNRKQVYFIKDSFVIKNDNGTAPGMIFEKNGKVVINLPGPPKELIPMLNETVIPYLKKKNKAEVYKKQYRLMNVGESHAETMIKSLYVKYPDIKIAPYASVGMVDYMITSTGSKDTFNECCTDFESLMKDHIIGNWDKTIQEILVERLSKAKLTLAIAESCTGGMVSSSIVDVSGSSKVLLEGLVTYSNEAKMSRLGVKEETLNEFGAVSPECAREMAEGAVRNMKADIGLAITGIAGPTGGTKEKPVGLVYTAIYYNGQTIVKKNHFSGDRYKVRQRSMMGILYDLYQLIKTL